MAGQGDEENAKDDTRFYGVDYGAGLADLANDLSQLGDSLQVGTNCIFEASSSRWNPTPPLALEFDVLLDSTDTGVLYMCEGFGSGLRLSVLAGGVIEARANNSVIATVTVPSLGPSQVAIGWSMEANVFTTNATNAIRSELRAWNVDSEEFVQTVATHAMPVTPAATTAIWLARTTTGTNPFTGTANRLRWSVGRFHPAAETREDMWQQTLIPSLGPLRSFREVPVPRRASGLGDDGQFVGPIYQAVAASLRGAALRQAGRIVDEVYRDSETMTDTHPARRAWTFGVGFSMLGQFLVRRPVPKDADRLKVRVHVQAWRSDAASSNRIVIRCYSMTRPPIVPVNQVGVPIAYTTRHVEQAIQVNHGNATTGGAWFEFDGDLLEIVRDESGQGTWLALAFAVETAGGGPVANQNWRVRAWTVEPGRLE